MEFIFHFGGSYDSLPSNFLDNIMPLIGTLFGSSIGAFVAIFIFKQGLDAEKKKEKRKRDERTEKLENTFYSQIKMLVTPLEEQIGFYNDDIENLTKDSNDPPNFISVPSLYIANQVESNFQQFFEVFILKENIEHPVTDSFIKVISSLNYIKSYNLIFDDNFNLFRSKVDLYGEQWNESLHQINRDFEFEANEELEKNGSQQLSTAFLINLRGYFSELEKIDDYTRREIVYENLIEPMLELCNTEFKDSRTHGFKSLAMNAKRAHSDIIHAKKLFANYISGVVETLENSKNDINSMLRHEN